MKKKGTPGRKNSPGELSILCPACSSIEFKRSISETDAIVRIAFNKEGTDLQETIIREGLLRFRYCCAKCGAMLLDSSKLSKTSL